MATVLSNGTNYTYSNCCYPRAQASRVYNVIGSARIYIAYYTSKSGIWRDISRVASYFHEPKASANTAYE